MAAAGVGAVIPPLDRPLWTGAQSALPAPSLAPLAPPPTPVGGWVCHPRVCSKRGGWVRLFGPASRPKMTTHARGRSHRPSLNPQAVGLALSPRSRRPDVSRLDISADLDDAVPVPNLAGKPVPAGSRKFLDYAPLWAKWPDVSQVLFVNRIIRTLWPRYNAAIGKIATDVAGPILEEICKKGPAGILQAVDIEKLDLGGFPLAIGGIKTYATKDDSCIFEAPIQWGSTMAVRIAARLKLGPFVIHLPIDVENVQVRAVARVSLRPLVDELPCLGGAEVSLLELPHYDLSLRIINAVDLMRLPGVKTIVDAAVAKVIGDLALYPNRFRVDLMPGGGVPPPPLGMVEVAIERVERISDGGTLFSKVDPYVEVRCRRGRVTRTRTIYNNASPVYNETIAAIVDDPDNQALHVSLYDDNGGYNDKLIGELELPLLTSDFFAAPRTDVKLVVPFSKPAPEDDDDDYEYAPMDGGGATGGVGSGPLDGGATSLAAKKAKKPKEKLKDKVRRLRGKPPRPEVGLIHMTARYLPFRVDPSQLERLQAAKDAAAAARKAQADAAIGEAKKELEEASAAVGAAVATSKRDKADLEDATLTLGRAVSTARRAGVDVSGVSSGAAPDAAPVAMSDVKTEVAEAVEAAEDAVDAAAALKQARKEADRVAAEKVEASKRAAEVPVVDISEGPITQDLKGILTLTLVCARNLTADGQVDPFVELSLFDPATGTSKKQTSATWNNEPNPKWGEKFDFVNISATSVLTVTVWDKKGVLESVVNAVKSLASNRAMVEKIGVLRLRVDEIARNRRIKDEWALQETQKGDIMLQLEWFPVAVDDGTDAAAPAKKTPKMAAAAALSGL